MKKFDECEKYQERVTEISGVLIGRGAQQMRMDSVEDLVAE